MHSAKTAFSNTWGRGKGSREIEVNQNIAGPDTSIYNIALIQEQVTKLFLPLHVV